MRRNLHKKLLPVKMCSLSISNVLSQNVFLIPPHVVFSLKEKYILQGHGFFTENSDKHIEGVQNEQSKNGTPSKSLEKSEKGIYQKCLEKLSDDFELLLDPKASCFADVNLKCGDVTIPAHKNILSTRSPVFAAMFTNPMKESIKNEVDITDIDMPTVRALLTYMYTGKTDLTGPSATDLLFAADKYQLQELKSVCSDFLKNAASLQKVIRILVLGDLIDEDLKSVAMDYICD